MRNSQLSPSAFLEFKADAVCLKCFPFVPNLIMHCLYQSIEVLLLSTFVQHGVCCSFSFTKPQIFIEHYKLFFYLRCFRLQILQLLLIFWKVLICSVIWILKRIFVHCIKQIACKKLIHLECRAKQITVASSVKRRYIGSLKGGLRTILEPPTSLFKPWPLFFCWFWHFQSPTCS